MKSNDFTNIEKLTEIITEIIKPYSFEDMANAVFCINSYAGNRSLIEVSLALNNAIIEYNDFGEKRINSYTDFSNLCRKLGDAIGKQSFVDYIDPDMGEVKISAFDNVYSVILGTGYNNCFSKIHSLPTLAELLECEEHVKYIFEYSSAMIDSLRHINSQLDDEEYSELNVPPEDFYNVATKSFGICQSKWNLEQIDRFIKQDFIERTHFVRRKERYFPLYNTSILIDVYDQLCTLLSDEQESRLIDNVINKLLWDIYKYDVGIKSKMLSPCMLVDSNDPIAGEKGLVFTMAGKNGIIIGLNATVYDDAELDGVCNKIQKAHHNKTLSSIELMHRCSETAYLKASLSSDKVFVVLINSVLTHEHEEVQNKYYSFVSECSLSDMIYYLCFSDDADELINYLQFKHNHSNMKILGFGGDSSLFLTWKLQNERIEGGAVSFTMLTLDPSIDSSYVINYYNEMFSKYPWYRDPLMDPVYSWKHKVITDGVLESVSKSGNFGGRLFLFAEANFKLFNCTNTEFFLEEKEVEEISKFQDIDEITFTIIESLRSSFNHCKELDSLTIVNNNVLEMMGRDKNDVFRQALNDSWRIDTPVLHSMQEKLFGDPDNLLETGADMRGITDMYILSNNSGIHGAAALFYPEVQERIAEVVGQNYYALPSSTEEFIIVPEEVGMSPRDLTAMVRDANRTVVSPAEKLSDNVLKSEKVKKAKKEGTDELTKKEKKELSDEEKEYKSMRKQIQEKLIKFATRIPVFMYLTDYRERTLKDVITQLEPGLFKKVTGLDVPDFEMLCTLGVFNASLMNDAIFKFKRYEDSSLSYTGIDKHEGMDIGGWDTTLKREEYDQLFYNQQATMEAPVIEQPETIVEIPVVKPEPKATISGTRKKPSIVEAYGGSVPASKVAESTKVIDDYSTPKKKSEKTPEVDLTGVIEGASVIHNKFGEGTIVFIDQKMTKIRVQFSIGEKTFVIEQGNQYNVFATGLLKLK